MSDYTKGEWTYNKDNGGVVNKNNDVVANIFVTDIENEKETDANAQLNSIGTRPL
jgi:hypothetical protein